MSPDESQYHSPTGLAHLRSTVAWTILPECVLFGAISASVCLIFSALFPVTGFKIGFPYHFERPEYVRPFHIATTLLTVFGFVLGFIVSYRTSSAYERYSEGRRLWASVTLTSRTVGRLVWYHVPDRGGTEREVVRSLIEKKTIINLVGAFSVALKHYLRGESGIYYKDLYPLVLTRKTRPKYQLPTNVNVLRDDLDAEHSAAPMAFHSPNLSGSQADPLATRPSLPSHLSRDATFSSNSTTTTLDGLLNKRSHSMPRRSDSGRSELTIRRIVPPVTLLPSRNPPPKSPADYVPLYSLFHDIWQLVRGKAKQVIPRRKGNRRVHARQTHHESSDNIPLEITLLLSGWISAQQRMELIDTPTITALLNSVLALTDSLTGLERILLTPIPVAYSLHLRHIIWIWLTLLPFQIENTMGWLSVPATMLAAFMFLGLMTIGAEIESPFGYDDNDLPIDAFALSILKELRELTAHEPAEADPRNFVYVADNLPFATAPLYEGRSALELSLDESLRVKELHAMLKRERRAPLGKMSENEAELRRVQSLV